MKRKTLVLSIVATVLLLAGTALAGHGHRGHGGHGGHHHGGHGRHHHHGHYGFGLYVAPPVVPPPVVVYPAPAPPPVYYPYVHRYYAYPSSNFHYHGRNFGLSIGF